MKTRFAAVLGLTVLLLGCGGGQEETKPIPPGTFQRLGLQDAKTPEELSKDAQDLAKVPIDAPPRLGKDYYHPVFPPLLPFDSSEWQTHGPTPSVADPRAKKGGKIVLATTDWPPTIRTEGPNSRLLLLFELHSMVYETLLGYDDVEQTFLPNLAKYWQVGEDKMTYRFRIDERARWADGLEVTADDVVATFEHLLNPDRKDPLTQQYLALMIDHVKMLDKYTVEVKTKHKRWRDMITIATGTQIYPAAYIRMDGETYLKDWNWKLPPGSGPYEIRPQDIVKGTSISLHRRKDWWQGDFPENKGAFNFDEIKWLIVRDQELMYQKLLQHDQLDMYRVTKAQRWVEELDREPVIQKGWVQKRKIYNKDPQGYGGYCFNLRHPPFDSRNVRLAFAHLFNREKLFAKLFFYQYDYIDSYFPGQKWARPNAKRVHYDPDKARELLRADGWVGRDSEGYLVDRDGKRFPTLTLEFSSPGFERIHQVVQHDLWNEAGIKMDLKLIDPPSLLKKVWDFQFDLVYWAWTASLFPEPIQQFDSRYADQKQTNNLNGFKNAEADKIMEDYQTEFDPKKRIKMLQHLDQILFDAHIYALGWYAPYFRIIYWDKFGHPPEYAARTASDWLNIMTYWWYDADKDKRTETNRSRNLGNYPDSPYGLNQEDAVDQTWWNDHDRPMRYTPKKSGGTGQGD